MNERNETSEPSFRRALRDYIILEALIWWSVLEFRRFLFARFFHSFVRSVIMFFHSMTLAVFFTFFLLLWQTMESRLQKVKTSRKAEQYQNNSHLSCFEKWLKIFCKAFVWWNGRASHRLIVWELSEAKTAGSRLMPMGQSHHWNRIAFIWNTNWEQTMAICSAAAAATAVVAAFI